jgi:hypothetical protein
MKAMGDWYVGKTFGKWSILSQSESGVKHPKLTARCECGKEQRVNRDNILSGKSTGCRKCSGKKRNRNPAWAGHKDIPGLLFGVMVRGAAERNMECSVTIEDLQAQWERQKGVCALTGVALLMASKSSERTASVDRIDSKRGYCVGNVQFVHKHINKMKNNLDEEYFVEMCKRVAWHKAAA